MTIEIGELATSVEETKTKVKTKFIYLDNTGNKKITSLIAFTFGMLVNVGKKVGCLHTNECKSYATQEILTAVMTYVILRKRLLT